ncbi:uncharacterized protein LOC123526253 isoform X2 [Mercenaria mercenaria]|uniref:uncharacterized protein LOC123526253 isoform X2 n=1 Tax=Mercenaria mercenaria TaxID=6596 RepID=UPI00234F9AB6|nr:uncharacterized protein LOC123526253 isoform X2 [Mercenaria mercenaria]
MKLLQAVVVLFGLNVLIVAQNEHNQTGGLRCYSCASTGGNNYCEDYNTYKQAMDGKGYEKVKKDCTPPYNVTCMIESFEVLGNTVSHIRGCSDGIHFSFSSNLQANRSAYERLEKLTTNNETACVWDGQNQVCLTKCDTNFCNGPQLEEVINNATVTKVSSLLMLLVIFASTIFQR